MKTDSVDAYIRQYPKEVQRILRTIRELIRNEAPDAVERIAYGIPTFSLNGNLVHFAAFKNHIGFYPTSSGIRTFEAELKKYVHAKGSVQFPLDRAIPYSLIRRIVAFRIAENGQKASRRRTLRSASRRHSPATNH
jgi:uncharacterized protein YdhG (YjbR/CyaY superfamily)